MQDDIYASLPDTPAGLALRARRPLDAGHDGAEPGEEDAVERLMQARDLFVGALEEHPSEEL